MKICASCGQRKPYNALSCPTCHRLDEEIARVAVSGTPLRTLLIIGVAAFWLYRFWRLGWIALPGNLRWAAFLALGLGLAGLFGPMWSFGVRTRKQAAYIFVIALLLFIALQFV
ncbi:MAG: hypothetical protein ABJB61_12775 [bacterium]